MPVSQVVDEIPNGFLGSYPEGSVEAMVGGDDLQIGVQHQQRLPHGLHDALGIGPGIPDLLQQPLHILVLMTEPALLRTDPQMGLHPGINLLQLERLRHVVRPTQTERFHLVHGLMSCAHEDDRYLCQQLIGLDLPAEFIAVHFRHVDVQQNQVGRFHPGGPQRQRAADNSSRPISPGRQHFFQEQDVGRHVVHDQDVWGFLFGLLHHDLLLCGPSGAAGSC